MKFFGLELGKKGDAADKTKRQVVLVSDQQSNVMAFGLRWSVVATAGGKEVAKKMARERKASHYVLCHQRMGYGSFNIKDFGVKPNEKIYSAADVAALQFGGDSIHAYEINEGEFWVGVIRNGAPTGEDNWMGATTQNKVAERVQALVAQGAADNIRYVVYGSIDSGLLPTIQSATAEDLFLALANGASLLESSKASGTSIPKPLIGLIGVSVAGLVGWELWDRHQQEKARELAAAQAAIPEDPPEVAWAKAIKSWSESKSKPTSTDIGLVLKSIGKLGVKNGSWHLVGVKCDAAGVGAAKQWLCSADYARDKGRDTYASLSSLPVPEGATFKYRPINGASAVWTVSSKVDSLEMQSIPSADTQIRTTVAAIQRFSGALSGDVDLPWTSIDVPAPKRNDGTAYARPAEMTVFKTGAISLKGPLRTVETLLAKGVEADWTKLWMSFEKGDPRQSALGPQESNINADLVGVIYAK